MCRSKVLLTDSTLVDMHKKLLKLQTSGVLLKNQVITTDPQSHLSNYGSPAIR